MTSPERSPATSSTRSRAHQAETAWWARLRARARRHPLLTTVLVLLTATLALGLGDLGLLYSRLERFDVAMPQQNATGTALTDGGGPQAETWLVIGTDSRTSLPDGPARYGGVEDVGDGARADVAALVRPSATGLDVLILPRDLVVAEGQLFDERLATSFLQGPQYTVDALCSAYGITTAHVVTVDMAQFAGIVDAVGGIDVELDEPVRDAYAGLEIDTAGMQHLDGVNALALVRSRHPEVLRDGQWVALSEQEGAERRSRFTGIVMRSVMSALVDQGHGPLTLQSLAWALSGNLGVDAGTGLRDLAGLARSVRSAGGAPGDSVRLVEVPAGPVGDGFAAPPTDQTYATLAEYGYAPGACTPTD